MMTKQYLNKWELIFMLEGRETQAPNGDWNRVENGKVHTRFGAWNLVNYDTPTLEVMYRQSRERKE